MLLIFEDLRFVFEEKQLDQQAAEVERMIWKNTAGLIPMSVQR